MSLAHRIELYAVAVILLAAPAGAEFGQVVRHDRKTIITSASGGVSCPAPQPSGDLDAHCRIQGDVTPVNVGDSITTEDGGRAEVLIFDERYPTDRRQFDVIENTTVTIYEDGLDLSDPGAVHWIGRGTLRLSHGREVEATGTEFIIRTSPGGVAEIVALSEGVEVRDRAQEVTETLHLGDRVQLSPGMSPQFLERLVGEDLKHALKPFAFIGGGRAESQTVRNALLTGDEVPHPDRAPLPAPRWRDDDRWWPEQPVFIDLLTHF